MLKIYPFKTPNDDMNKKIIWCDTRNKKEQWDWIKEEFLKRGYAIKDDKPMTYGDYCMPPNLSLIVETKYCIQEIEGNITNNKDHIRFRNELIGAYEMGCKVYVLIIDENVKDLEDLKYWINPRLKNYQLQKIRAEKKNEEFTKKPPTNGVTLSKALKTMQEKYNATFLFCKKEECANKIIELLDRNGEQ